MGRGFGFVLFCKRNLWQQVVKSIKVIFPKAQKIIIDIITFENDEIFCRFDLAQ